MDKKRRLNYINGVVKYHQKNKQVELFPGKPAMQVIGGYFIAKAAKSLADIYKFITLHDLDINGLCELAAIGMPQLFAVQMEPDGDVELMKTYLEYILVVTEEREEIEAVKISNDSTRLVIEDLTEFADHGFCNFIEILSFAEAGLRIQQSRGKLAI